MLRDHCDQLVSRSTFYRHQSEGHFVDSEEEQFDPIPLETWWPSERSPESFSDALLESGPNGQRCDNDAAGSVDEDNDMDHTPAIDEDSESVSSILRRADFIMCLNHINTLGVNLKRVV